jgi:hypothetical protein
VTTFYISPSSLSYREYNKLIYDITKLGWAPPWVWPRQCFYCDCLISNKVIERMLKALTLTDIFIACVPGTASTNIEIGAAYTLCEEVFLVAKDPVHFTQTGLSDAIITVLPGVKRVCCEINEIPIMLQKEYPNLINC